MPYIKPHQRDYLDDFSPPSDPGELNYLITKLCNDYLSLSDKKYSDYNEVIGVLECAKLELYRRLVSPYEDQKKEENGDVYSV